MKIIGLTGGSGSGKSIVAAAFAEHGIKTLDTDAVYHHMISANTPCTQELIESFGSSIAALSGGIDRAALRRAVLGDDASAPQRLALLNRITHKYVLAECEAWLIALERDGAAFGVIDAPQLYESGFDARCDAVIAVTAPQSLRVLRIMARDAITEEQALQRIRAQRDDAFFKSHADFLIVNDENEEQVKKQVAEILGILSR
ncbi:MAG: dephospho-CoA kinase [Clostridia bacterium]|nr:dephospho-CoA kinase [Clostridia bacterium]